jgi:hypothetical protein
MKLIKNKLKKEKWNMLPALLTDDMSVSAGAVILWTKLWNSNKGKVKGYKEWQPTTQGLATMFKVDKRTIKRWLKELKDSGWITIIGDRKNTIITIHFTPVLVSKMSPIVGVKNVTQYYYNPDSEKSLPEIETKKD